jgi:polysaccharide export outer membrane protein
MMQMNYGRHILFAFSALAISSCGTIYNPQTLPGEDAAEDQQSIALEVVALTSSVAAEANKSSFQRRVVVGSNLSGAAQLLEESSFIKLRLPPNAPPPVYRVGVGDVLQFARLMPRMSENGTVADEYSVRLLPVTSEGYVSIVEVGRVDVVGKTISEVEASISGALLRSGVDPRFEVSVQGFNSQKIFLGGSVSSGGAGEGVVVEGLAQSTALPFTDRPISLDEVMTTSGIALDPGADKLIKIFRGGEEYRLSARDVLTKPEMQRVYLLGGDRVYVEDVYYRPETVMLSGEVGSQSLFTISSQERQTLSDALFSKGALSLFTSDSSQIYLIRRRGDIAVAYHLDGSNPARLSIASEIELRPQDVIFVAEQPITRFNRVMQQLLGAGAATYEIGNAAASEL